MTLAGFQFKPDLKVSILTLVLLPIMMSLGSWQLDRADEKQGMKAEFDARQQEPAEALGLLRPSPAIAYKKVKFSGVYLNEKNWLLDNRMHQGRPGYEIITPFKTDSGITVMVNRGWTKGDPSRRTLPEIEPVESTVELEGEVYVSSSNGLILKAIPLDSAWPKVIQQLDFKAFEQQHGDIFPYTVRIKDPYPGAYTNNWVVINITPEKHTGYAVQWFSMSAALVILFFALSIKRHS